MLYQLSYVGPNSSLPHPLPILERETGFEPATIGLEGRDSTTELLPPRFLSLRVAGLRFLAEAGGGRGRIRTSVARKGRQIYSLLPLATRPPVRASSDSSGTSSPKASLATLLKDGRAGQDSVLRLRRNPTRLPAPCREPSRSTSTSALVTDPSVPARGPWSWRRDSNPRPSDYKSDALPLSYASPACLPAGLTNSTNYHNRQENCKGPTQFSLP